MNKATLAKGLLTVPGVSAGMDILRSSDIGTTIGDLVGTVDGIMEIGNSTINPLFSGVAGGVSAGLLTNSVLKEFAWMEKHEKTRWLLSTIAAGTGYAAGTAAAPYLAAGGLAYAIGKYGSGPLFKLGKEVIKRGTGIAWGLTGGLVTGAAKSAWKGAKGEQKLIPQH